MVLYPSPVFIRLPSFGDASFLVFFIQETPNRRSGLAFMTRFRPRIFPNKRNLML